MKVLFGDFYAGAALVEEALSWEGSPFHLNGRSREGVGCVGLLQQVYGGFRPDFLDLVLPRGTGRHGDQLALRRMSRWLEAHPEFFAKGDVASPCIGDLVTFETNVGEFHCGLYLGVVRGQPRSILSAAARYGVTLNNLWDASWATQLQSVWRPLA